MLSSTFGNEVHRLDNPSETLKIAADEYPDRRVLATGSSTLAATSKFRDTLTGRKRVVHLCPVLGSELDRFGVRDLDRRLLNGGLPRRVIDGDTDPEFYAEWLDSYYARDVEELFRVGKRREFLQLVELLLRNSGQLFEVSSLAKHTGLARPTIGSYLQALEATHVVRIIRPFHARARRELLAQPKAYGFDTGFVCHFRGWSELRSSDRGPLLEHLVLDMLTAHRPSRRVFFWRDKQQREIDFVLPGSSGEATAIECKWKRDHIDGRNLAAFRSAYPVGRNVLVTAQPSIEAPIRVAGHVVHVCHVRDLAAFL